MILIECPATGDRCLVASTAGYEGWQVLAANVIAPPANCFWCTATSAWKVDAGAAAIAETLCKVRDPLELAKIIAGLTARIAALEAA